MTLAERKRNAEIRKIKNNVAKKTLKKGGYTIHVNTNKIDSTNRRNNEREENTDKTNKNKLGKP